MEEPKPIRKLDETVVNRIAAGEVIQRPANALKELLENSLDAQSTNIQVVVKDGGLKYLQIQDNGSGIRRDDLEIVCERFTTSKLTTFEDLTKINTYGFRGEALASISHVAHLTIITKTSQSQVGYKAAYEDSKLKGPPKPCASKQGTQITVEDLFYNISTRRKALTNYSEEHGRIADVVSKYAVHNPKVGFTLKKLGEGSSELRTAPNSTVVDNIRSIYGNNIAKELLEVTFEDDTLQFKLSGQITNVNYSSKKLMFLLFINHRLVNSTALKKTLEQIYSTYLPKGGHPFIYLSFELNPNNVDVNVHPTKHEVHFLHEDLILEKTKTVIENKLISTNSSRVFYTQSKLPQILSTTIETPVKDIAEKSDQEKKIYAHNMVRTDASDQKLDKYFAKVDQSSPEPEKPTPIDIFRREIKLRSILQLRTDVENELHTNLRNLVKDCTFVGSINSSQCLLQHSTKLYLCDIQNMLQELFYQIALYDFANFGVLRFSSPISLKELATIALDTAGEELGWTEADGSKEDTANNISELLSDKSVMLEDYFSIEITDSNLCTLPLMLDKYTPDISYLPMFVVRLATEVDWNLEKPCLRDIGKELGKFYSQMQSIEETTANSEESNINSSWKWTTEHILIPAMKSSLLPPSHFAQDGTILEIANLPDLYKVFERC